MRRSDLWTPVLALLLPALAVLVVSCGDDRDDEEPATSNATTPDTGVVDNDTSILDPDTSTNTEPDTSVEPDTGLSNGSDSDGQAFGEPQVGVRYLEVDVPGAAGRSLDVLVWYPADPNFNAEPYVYLGLLANNALKDAPIAPGGPWPLIVFSHGNGGVKEQSAFVTEGLAKAGYIVAAVDHTGNTFFGSDASISSAMNHMRPIDISALIDRMETPLESDPDWLKDATDLDNIGAIGHSRGGYTTLALVGADLGSFGGYVEFCEREGSDHPICAAYPSDGGPYDFLDTRIDAAVAMSPARYSVTAEGLGSVTVPTMVVTGKEDTLTQYEPMVRPIYEALSPPKLLWTLEHAGHYTFSNLCSVYDLLPPSQQAIFGNDCDDDGPLLLDDAHTLTTEAVTAWFDEHLKGMPAGDVLAPVQGDEVGIERVDE